MTGYAPRVVCHLGLLSFLGPLQPLSMALKTIPETQFLMHLDHLRIFAVANIAAVGLTAGRRNTRGAHKYEKQ